MSNGLWLPSGPITRAFELELIEAKIAGRVPSGLLSMAVARADAPLAARTAQFIPLDTTTGRLACSATVVPPSAATVLNAPVEVAAAGDNAVIAASPGNRIYVLNYELLTRGNVSVRFKSGVGGGASNLSGQFTPAPGTLQMQLSFTAAPMAVYYTAVGEALNIFLGAAVAIDGFLVYYLAP